MLSLLSKFELQIVQRVFDGFSPEYKGSGCLLKSEHCSGCNGYFYSHLLSREMVHSLLLENGARHICMLSLSGLFSSCCH